MQATYKRDYTILIIFIKWQPKLGLEGWQSGSSNLTQPCRAVNHNNVPCCA